MAAAKTSRTHPSSRAGGRRRRRARRFRGSCRPASCSSFQELLRAVPWRRRTGPAVDKPAAPAAPAAAADPAVPKSGQAQLVLMGIVTLWRSPPQPTVFTTSWLDAFSSPPTTPMCAPIAPCSARGCPVTSRQSFPAITAVVRAGEVIFKIETAIIASRSTPRAPRSPPSRPPSIASPSDHLRWRAAVEQAKAQWLPRMPA